MSAAGHRRHHSHERNAALQIELFGGVTISVDGNRVTDFATRKAEALLIYLVCNPRPHRRETLAELLWDDLPAERAAGNLRLTLNQLRKHAAPFLDITRQTIAMRDDMVCWLDVEMFARVLAAKPYDPDTIAEALRLYRGDFLQGFYLRDARGFSEWQLLQTEHLRQQALLWMRLLVDRYTAYSRYADGIIWAKGILEMDPLDEAAHRQLMLLFARSGQRQAAIRQYKACRELLREEYGLEPEPATEALIERLSSTPAQRSITLIPATQLFVGRATELAQVFEWLSRPTDRLMTITGPGGSGKTQLALTAGWRIANDHLGPCSDGVFYLSLVSNDQATPQIEDDEALMAVAKALHISLSNKGTVVDQLVQHISNKEILLTIDNGELFRPSARLALSTLLQHTSGLRVLVASRERLKLREECVLHLKGLSYPIFSSRKISPQREQAVRMNIPDFASVQFFLECARRVQGMVTIDDYAMQDQVAIGRICELVHGLPLAIELATPWLSLCSPSEIWQAISENIDMLSVDRVDIPERHRSIRAVFEYSWRLLLERERTALANLAVFPGSFTADAAASIGEVPLQVLASLHDKSLVQSIKMKPSTRYMLHPLLQCFALEKLRCDPLAERAIRARHADYFATFAAQHEEQLRSAQGADVLGILESEFDNLRAGWRWAADKCDIQTLGQYSIALHDFCAIRSWELEGQQLFQSGAAAVRLWMTQDDCQEQDTPSAARVLSCYAELEHILGDLDAAEEAFQQARMLLEGIAVEDSQDVTFIYKQLGLIAHWRGACDQAMQYLQLTLAIAEETADNAIIGDTLLAIGAVALAQGDWQRAEEALEKGLAVYRAMDFEWGIGHSLRFIGMLAVAQGEISAAHHYLHNSLTIAQKLGNRLGEALVLDQQGLLYLYENQHEQSADTLTRALAMFQDLGLESGIGRVSCHLGRLAVTQCHYREAQQYFLQAIQVSQSVRSTPLLLETMAGALHLLLAFQPTMATDPVFSIAVISVWRHPACTADTKQYLASVCPDQLLSLVAGAEPLDQKWSLEELREVIVSWIAGTPRMGIIRDALHTMQV